MKRSEITIESTNYIQSASSSFQETVLQQRRYFHLLIDAINSYKLIMGALRLANKINFHDNQSHWFQIMIILDQVILSRASRL